MLDHIHPTSTEEQLRAVLASQFFARKGNARVLLEFLIRRAMENPRRSANRREVVKACFPGRTDEQIASTEKQRLRGYLSEYYADEGLDAPLRFVIPERLGFRILIERHERDGRSGFVGREWELAAMARAFARANSGSFSLLLVEGAAGVGKTAIIQMHSAFCRGHSCGARVGVAVACEAESGVDPCQLLDELLESLCKSADGSLRAELKAQLEGACAELGYQSGSDSFRCIPVPVAIGFVPDRHIDRETGALGARRRPSS